MEKLAETGITFITKKRRNMKADALAERDKIMLLKRFIITRYLSSFLFVGCTHPPRSHSSLCSLAVAMHLEIHRV
uniref:transposase n=1 Tax=Photorhabdus sp. CRCIA-P01 TaxID=2019570 RepID=UPI001E47232E|nr:transposase [Photorhabdus sp. CRCIA-P01]